MSSNDQKPLPKGWVRHMSRSQNRYYFIHTATQKTQWTFPTPDQADDDDSAAPPAVKRARLDQPAPNFTKSKPSVAIIVPFRDLHPEQQRSAHLARFVPHMTKFLSKLQSQGRIAFFHVYIVDQSNDGRKFNRGKLLNIGFDVAVKRHNIFIFHDVDLLPHDDLGAWYSKYPEKQPVHIARVWKQYSNNPKYFGGIVSMSEEHYRAINGYPNTFWYVKWMMLFVCA